MIIRMTVNDNDFGNFMVMDDFVKNLTLYTFKVPEDIEQYDSETQIALIREVMHVDKLLNPNVTEEWTKEDRVLIEKRVKDAFSLFLKGKVKEDTRNYLANNFQVRVVDYVEDKWENGEMYYWFQHSGMYICQ